MQAKGAATDPITVLQHLSKLRVTVGGGESSEPSTPPESPACLDVGLREWLHDTLSSGSGTAAAHSKVYVKLLVSNAAAGSIIGKAGGNINELQAKSYARIQLSKSGEYFPGTAERTLLVVGRLKQVIAALGLILAKLVREGIAPPSGEAPPAGAAPAAPAVPAAGAAAEEGTAGASGAKVVVKLLVPSTLCGIIIGRGGHAVRACSGETGAQIRVTPEVPPIPLNHRVVMVSGNLGGVLRAVALLTLKQCEDPKYSMFGELPQSYLAGPPHAYASALGLSPAVYALGPSPLAAAQLQYAQHAAHTHYLGGAAPPAFETAALAAHGGYRAPGADAYVSMAVALREDHAEAVLGRSGRGMEDVQASLGVQLVAEGQEGYDDVGGGGDGGRHLTRITISGPAEAVHHAHFVMGQRLAAALQLQQQQQYGGYPGSPQVHQQFNGTTYYHVALPPQYPVQYHQPAYQPAHNTTARTPVRRSSSRD